MSTTVGPITTDVIRYADNRARSATGEETGYCALGVRYILDSLDIPNGRGNAHDYLDGRLENADSDWQRVETVTSGGREYSMEDLQDLSRAELDDVLTNAEDLPSGALLVYDHDIPRGPRGGSKWGHVEFAVDRTDGSRIFVSDAVADRPGGTVPDRIAAIYIHPELVGNEAEQRMVAGLRRDLDQRTSGERPDRTAWLDDETVVDDLSGLGELDQGLMEMMSQLMMMLFASIFMGIFNGNSQNDQSAPTRLPTQRQIDTPPVQNEEEAAPDSDVEAGAEVTIPDQEAAQQGGQQPAVMSTPP